MTQVKKKRKKNKFFYFFIVYVLLLIALGAYFLHRVRATLIEMDKNDVDNVIASSLENLTDEEIDSLFVYNDVVETTEESRNNIRAYFNSDAYEIMKKEKNVYAIVDKERKEPIFFLKLKTLKSINKLGLINYDILEYDGVEAIEGVEFYHLKITAPSDYTITVNGYDVEPNSKSSFNDFKDAYEFVDIGSTDVYEFRNLTKQPSISIKDGDKDIAFEYSDDIKLTQETATYNSLEEAGVNFDVLTFCENWSKFMTDDIDEDAADHGYYIFANDLISGSEFQQKAYQWGTSIDITFTSIHELLNPPFTNVSVSNVVEYNSSAYSVDVVFDKNMLLEGGEGRVDHFNNRIFLIYYDGGWKVINMQGLKDG